MKQRKKERPAVRTFYNRLLRLPALILSITVLLGILPAAATDSVPKDYVTDGLILHLDAIDNEGTGTHSAEATGWVNLVNPGETIDIRDNAWGTDYLDLNNYIVLPDSVRQAICGKAFTVEFLLEDFDTSKDSGTIRNLMALTGDDEWIASLTEKGATPNDSFVIFMNQAGGNNDGKFCFRTCYTTDGVQYTKVNSSGPDYAKVDAAAINQVTNTITFQSGGNSVWYLDGETASTAKNTSNTVSADGFVVEGSYQTERPPQVIFGAASDTVSNRAFSAKIKAIRIYNRELTAEEAAQNAAADEARYYPQPEYDEDGYIQDGLVVRLDGLNNTGHGHSNSAGVWTNLADPSQSISLNGNSWGTDGQSLSIGAGTGMDYIILPDSVRQAIAGGQFTIEFLMDDYCGSTSQATANIMALTGSDQWIAQIAVPGRTPNDNFVIYQNSSQSTVNFKANDQDVSSDSGKRANVSAGSIDGATNALSYQNGSSTVWYQNGEVQSTSDFVYNYNPNVTSYEGAGAGEVPQVIFGAATDTVSNRVFSGSVKAIRIYDRTLNAAEIRHNAEIDAERFVNRADYERLAQESWNAVIEHNPNQTTCAGLQAYAEEQLSSLAAKHLDVEVADAGGGRYTFTYSAEGFSVSHTLYVDCEYTVDFSAMTELEQDDFLSDLLQYDGGAGLTQCKVEDGVLLYQGNNYPRPVSSIYLPVYYSGDEYVFEAEIAIPETIGGNWATMCFGKSDLSHHFQYAFFKQNDGTGAEFCRENGPANWTGHINTPILDFIGTGEGKISQDKYEDLTSYVTKPEAFFQYKAIVKDDVLYGFIDGVQVLTANLSGNLFAPLNGGFGFNTSGPQLKIKKIRISTDLSGENVDWQFNPRSSYHTDIYEPATDINAAPIVMQSATPDTSDVSGEAARPSALIFDVRTADGVLYAYGGDTLLGTFSDLYVTNQPKTNVGARIALGDTETANALASFVRENGAGNLWVISNDVELLEIVTGAAGTVRGVVDFTGETLRAPGNISHEFGDDYAVTADQVYEYVTYNKPYDQLSAQERYDALFGRGYRTALLPESAVTKEHVHYLQGNLIYVLVETETAVAEEDFYDLIVTGVNGILSKNYKANLAALEGELFEAGGGNILVRGGHVVGHRGDMGNESANPENSVESIVSAAQSGASSVEFDVYMTLDKKLILMHNNNITGYFVYDDDAPLTEEQKEANNVKTITQRSWEGDLEYLHSTYNEDIRMQQLYQLYEAIDTEFPELRLHHEIKDGRTETLNRIIDLMDKYGLRSCSDMMCFTKSVVEYVTSMGISAQYLATVSSYHTPERIYATEIEYRPLNSTWHATWDSMNTEFLEELKHFGQTAYPWPTSDEAVQDAYYVQGYQGFTTDIPHHTDDYIREILPAVDPETGRVTAVVRTLAYHEPGTFDEGSTYVEPWWNSIAGPTEYQLDRFELIPVSGTPVLDNECLTAFGDADDLVAIRCRVQLTGDSSYYVYSESFLPAQKQAVSIGILTEPEKVSYLKGEQLDVAGGTVQVVYNDGSRETIDMTAAMVSGFDPGTVGRQILTVTWAGQTATYYVAVSNAAGGGTSGSSSGRSPAYSIELSAGTGGTISSNVDSAKAGSSVAVTVCTDNGYTVEDVQITDHAGRKVPATVEDGICRFIMPAGGVHVTVSFQKVEIGHTDLQNDGFEDVSEAAWYYEAVNYVVDEGLFNGVSTTMFAPNETMSRAMLVTVLYRMEGEPAVPDESVFPDVAGGSYYEKAVVWAAESGIVNGYSDGTFRPETGISREQMAAILYRYAAQKGGDMSAAISLDAFSDASRVSGFAAEAVRWAVGRQLLSGIGAGMLDPQGYATRAQVAVVLMRFAAS